MLSDIGMIIKGPSFNPSVSSHAQSQRKEGNQPDSKTNGGVARDVFETATPRPELSALVAVNATPPPRETGPSKYWANPGKEMDVDIDGYDFDFKPRQQLGEHRAKGYVDGPFSHNGKYEILKNNKEELKLKAQFGTNSRQDNDMNVTFTVRDGKATVSGTAKGKQIPEGTKVPVTGAGTERSPFQIKFTDENRKLHTLKWRPE